MHTGKPGRPAYVPARFLSEMSCFSGEPIAADDPALPKPPKTADGL